MKSSIASPAVCALNGLLYVTCGVAVKIPDENYYESNKASSSMNLKSFVQVYNPILDQWQELAPMISPRAGCRSVSLNNKIYVIGGSLHTGQTTDIVERYDPYFNKWESCANMLEKRSKPGVCVLNNLIYVIGGEKDGNILNSIESYDVIKNEWNFVNSNSVCSNLNWFSAVALRLKNPLHVE